MTFVKHIAATAFCFASAAALAQTSAPTTTPATTPATTVSPGNRAASIQRNWKPVARNALTAIVSVAMPAREDLSEAPSPHCTGVALSKTHVLTNGTCVSEFRDYTYVHSAERFEVLSGPRIDAASPRQLVAEVIRHPDFEPISRRYDLAILRLRTPLPDHVQPIRLVSELPAAGAAFSQAGLMANDDDSVTASEMDIPAMPGAQCETALRDDLTEKSQSEYVELIRSMQIPPETAASLWRQLLSAVPKDLVGGRICVATEEGFPCDVDKGALLLTRVQGEQRLAGIFSQTPGCDVAGLPGVFTGIANHLPWIQQTLAKPLPAATAKSGSERQFPVTEAAARLAGTRSGQPQEERGGERIIGGVPAVPGTYPFQVSLILAESPRGEEFAGFYCGGTRIGERHVLTAAHCTAGTQDKPITAADVEVYLGHDGFRGGERIPVRKITVHPGWSPVTLANDIAVIELERAPATLAATAVIDLHKPGAAYPQRARAIGWGATGFQGPSSRNLRETPMAVVQQRACDQHYRAFETRAVRRIVGQVAQLMGLQRASEDRLVRAVTDGADPRIGPAMICAGSLVGARSTCQGDSGGPLFSEGADGRPTQIGIVSWGVACDTRDVYGVFTDVSKYADWIAEATK